MKKILVVSETYYPDSRATIAIVQRMMEAVQIKGYEVYVLPIKAPAKGVCYPSEHNNVSILNFEDYLNKIDSNTFLVRLGKKLIIRRKISFAVKHLMISDKDNKPYNIFWNRWIRNLRKLFAIRWITPCENRIRDISGGLVIKRVTEQYHIDTILSVSLPFWIHHFVCEAGVIEEKSSVNWIPLCFDPYAYDQNIDKHTHSLRQSEEQHIFLKAKKIMMLSESREDYLKDPIFSKIDFLKLPNLRKMDVGYVTTSIVFDKAFINCIFIGNLYWKIRNPEFLLKLFHSFSNNRIRLYMIGSLSYDFPEDYMEKWKNVLKEQFINCGRVSSEEAVAIMNQADILINIGNTTSNQCPSKVIEYISTGKPIINISKIDRCTSEAYLKRYPLSCLISEREGIIPAVTEKVEHFIVDNYNNRLQFEEIQDLFSDCTNERAVEMLLDNLN